MKTFTYNFPILLILLTMIYSCQKDENVNPPDFSVSTAKSTYKVGEPVIFNFDGNADMITFFSGEPGNAYEYINQDRYMSPNMVMSFSTTVSSSGAFGYPNPAYAVPMYSTDFNGQYDQASVEAATWHDLSPNFKLPTDLAQKVLSGEYDITHLFPADGSPLYIAYYYKVNKYYNGHPAGTAYGRAQVQVSDFNIKGVTNVGEETVYDLYSAEWSLVIGANYETDPVVPAGNRPTLPEYPNKKYIFFNADFRPQTDDREAWAISKPLHMPDQINTGPDYGTGIKGFSDPTMKSYQHVYNTAGTYTVTFLVSNANIDSRKESTQMLTINVINDEGGIQQPGNGEWTD